MTLAEMAQANGSTIRARYVAKGHLTQMTKQQAAAIVHASKYHDGLIERGRGDGRLTTTQITALEGRDWVTVQYKTVGARKVVTGALVEDGGYRRALEIIG